MGHDFNRRLISSIRATKESALRINILEKKRKREVAAAAQVISSIRVTEGSALRINILEKKRKRKVAAAAQVID